MIKKVSYTFIFIFLLVVSIVPLAPNVQATPDEGWVNRYSYDVDYGNLTHTTTTYIGPQVFWDGLEWQELRFEDHYISDGYYLIENAHVAAYVYEWYTVFYDPDNQRVCVDDERWIVEVYNVKTEKWREVDLYSPSLTYSNNETHLSVARTFDCSEGLFNVTYSVSQGSFLKPFPVFISRISDVNEFRVTLKLTGVSEWKRVKHYERAGNWEIEDVVSPYFFVNNNNLTLFLSSYLWSLGHEDEEGTWVNDKLQSIKFQANTKIDIVIGNYTLAQDGRLEIDPAFSTWGGEPKSLPYVYSRPHTPMGTVYCSSENIVIGESVSGDHTTTHDLDGVYRQIDEAKVTGKYELEVHYDFANASDRTLHNTVTHDAYCYYTEGADLMVIEIYNWDADTWTTFDQKVPDTVGWVSNVIVASLPNPYISESGTVRIRFKDSDRDATQHTLYIDQQYDDSSDTWQTGAETDDVTPSEYEADHPPWDSLTTNTAWDRLGDFVGRKSGLGARFTGVTIPQGSSITSAYLQLMAYSTRAQTTVNLRLAAEDADDTITFSNVADYNARPRTSYVAWSNVGAWTANSWYNSPDIASIVELVVGRDGWLGDATSDMVIFCEDDGTSTTRRECYFYEQTGNVSGPKLEVTWSTGGDSTAPTYANVGKNTTLANKPCLFYTQWTDEIGLATTGGYIFGTNNTGSWQNETWTAFSSNPDWSNVTKTLTVTVGVVVQWQIWANDTSNNWNNTSTQQFTTTFYAEITIITTSHSWTITPGQSDILIDEGTITINSTCNVNYDIQIKGSGDLTYGSYTIALSNVKAHKDTLGSAIQLTTSYQDLPGLTNQAAGTDVQQTFKLWLTCPTGKPHGTYTYTCYVQIIQA